MKSRWSKAFPVVAGSLLAVVLSGAIIYAVLTFRFGSIGALQSYVQGRSLVEISPTRIDLGLIQLGQSRKLLTSVRNMSDEPILILGAHTSCSCTVTSTTFPITVTRGQEVTLPFVVHASGSSRDLVESSIELICNKGDHWPRFVVSFRIVDAGGDVTESVSSKARASR